MLLLQQKARALEAKRGELAALFKKYEKDGGYDMPTETVEEVNRRNDELAVLTKEYEDLRALDEIGRRNDDELRRLDRVRRPAPFSGAADRDAGTDEKSLGQLFVESPAFKEFRGGRSPVAEIPDLDLKTLFQTSAGWTPESLRSGKLVLSAQRPIRVVDLIPLTETGQAAVKWMEETTFTNNAAEAAEAGTYAENAFALTERSETVRKIAVFIPVTDEQFEDEPRARDYVNNRLLYSLQARLDSQLLVGSGVAPNLTGVLNKAGIQTQAKGADPTFDACYKAITKVRHTGFADPSGFVFHPNDWQDIRLTRTADGIYILGNPSEQGPDRLFGLPVAVSTAETENTGIVGDFAMYSELAVRRGIEFQVTNSHSTFFIEGKLAIRADVRVAFIIYRAAAFCTITGI